MLVAPISGEGGERKRYLIPKSLNCLHFLWLLTIIAMTDARGTRTSKGPLNIFGLNNEVSSVSRFRLPRIVFPLRDPSRKVIHFGKSCHKNTSIDLVLTIKYALHVSLHILFCRALEINSSFLSFSHGFCAISPEGSKQKKNVSETRSD